MAAREKGPTVHDRSPAEVFEQQHLDLLYRLLDAHRDEVAALKDSTMRASDGTPSGLFTRDALQYRYAERLAVLAAAEDKLCFGRLDNDDGEMIHIGRMGIADDTDERHQVLVDWRAPLAAPFYTATALAPQGVVRRRHIRTRRRQVESIADEFLQTPAPDRPLSDETTTEVSVGSDAPLLEALSAPRTGRMGDIIATIQAEQDAIIRSDHAGVLVVQGGPGTGKTVVALHRAAYLLYTHRARLGSHGVLVVGPSQTFLDYIGQVLPSLGETSVVLATIGTLVPGITATGEEGPRAAALKGRRSMTTVLDNAVLDRQRIPTTARRIPYDHGTVTLDVPLLRRAQRAAWASRRPHNRARAVFVRTVIDGLARQVADRPGVASLDPRAVAPSPAEIRAGLAADTTVRAALVDIWPLLTPQRLIDDLFSDPQRLAVAAPRLTASQRQDLLRPQGSPITEADVPLIDEAAELLGEIPQQDRAAAAALAEELAYARDTLEALGAQEAGYSDSGISFTLSMLSPEDIARLHDTSGPQGSTADRAAADRSWTYGHVIVDEAQELSAMAWRAIIRRCPLRSMTIVGDTAQTSSAAGISDWARALNPHVRDRWRLTELTVNYRTPAEIMEAATPVLAAINPELAMPESIRTTGTRPWTRRAAAAELYASVAEETAKAAADLQAGQIAVLHGADPAGARELLTRIHRHVPEASATAGPGSPVVVLPVHEAKGLEFDVVIVVEPARLTASQPHGLGDLYVAMTRATQQLGIVHSRPLPVELDPAHFETR